MLIFPGRLTAAGTFRIGVMGDLVESDMSLVLEAIDESLAELGVAATAPLPDAELRVHGQRPKA